MAVHATRVERDPPRFAFYERGIRVSQPRFTTSRRRSFTAATAVAVTVLEDCLCNERPFCGAEKQSARTRSSASRWCYSDNDPQPGQCWNGGWDTELPQHRPGAPAASRFIIQ